MVGIENYEPHAMLISDGAEASLPATYVRYTLPRVKSYEFLDVVV